MRPRSRCQLHLLGVCPSSQSSAPRRSPGSPEVAFRSGSVIGLPLDLTESFRSGTARGPRRIREVAESLEDYSPVLDADLSDRTIRDVGEIELAGLTLDESLRRIESA